MTHWQLDFFKTGYLPFSTFAVPFCIPSITFPPQNTQPLALCHYPLYQSAVLWLSDQSQTFNGEFSTIYAIEVPNAITKLANADYQDSLFTVDLSRFFWVCPLFISRSTCNYHKEEVSEAGLKDFETVAQNFLVKLICLPSSNLNEQSRQ